MADLEAEADSGLWQAFQRSDRPGAALVLIRGATETGTSALPSTLEMSRWPGRPYLATGRCTESTRDTPLTAILTALRELLRYLLAAPAESLGPVRAALRQVVGSDGALLAALNPELPCLLAAARAEPAAISASNHDRLSQLVQGILRVFTAQKQQVVLQLDDLQWADTLTVNLLSQLVFDDQQRHLVIIGTYCDQFADHKHPLLMALDDLGRQGAAIQVLQRPSSQDAVAKPLAPSSDCEITASRDDKLLVQAAQDLMNEAQLDRQLTRLLRLIVAHIQADRCVLLLNQEERLFIAAATTAASSEVQLGLDTQLELDGDLAESIVRFVARTQQTVSFSAVQGPGPFRYDPYLESRGPCAILCVAMRQRGRLLGLLYLERHGQDARFSPERSESCALLAAYVAIAVENVQLGEILRKRTSALGEVNQTIGEAYKLLTEANQTLLASNQQLERELHEREQAELGRAALQEELHRVQVPLIPITDRIMVMPLIGRIDKERARQILETVLQGASSSGAAVVILDITGVTVLDDGTTSLLIHAANALRLLGVSAVLTGVRAQLARQVVAQNLDIESLVTRMTLQSGIAYAEATLNRSRAVQRS